MKNNEAAMAFFKAMPKKQVINPYYTFNDGNGILCKKEDGTVTYFDVTKQVPFLRIVREYFRRVYEAFGTEAQVLVVSDQDADKLQMIFLPEIKTETQLEFIGQPVRVFVLPQINTPVNSSVSERFWQQYIIMNNITPIARIHSHHILDAYQSATDYSTLNSGSLEMVLGHVMSDEICVAYWLDEKGKPTKENVFTAIETENGFVQKQIPSGKPRV